MPRWMQRTVDAPPAAVLRRVTAAASGSQPPLRVAAATEGTLVAASRRHTIERDGIAVAWVELTALTPTATLLEIAAEEPGAQELVERIETAVCGPAVPDPREPVDARPRSRRHAVRAVAAVGVLALVAGSAAAYRLLAPPEPLAVDQAVAQFQQVPAPAVPVVLSTAPQVPRPSDGGDPAPRPRVDRVRRPPTSAETTRRRSVASPQAPTRQEASARHDQPEAQSQPSRRREAAAQPAPLPAAGVYTYTTSGHEEIDQPNDRHEYPRQTALTVQHAGCGFTTRWQPLEQRWDETEICAGEVRTLARMTTQREFFGQRKRSDYRCEPGSRAWQTDTGAAWTTRCSDEDTTVTTRFKVVGHEPLAVGEETVRAVHLRLRATMTGGTRGQWQADRWLHPETGLLLRLHGSTDATSTTTFGDVRYREQVRLDLQSLQPRR